MLRHHEFWHPKLFELPWYFYTFLKCVQFKLNPYFLLKANFGLDHGGIGFGSKFELQNNFSKEIFPKTVLLSSNDPKKEQEILKLSKSGFPIILKPDCGFCGKGILKIESKKDIKKIINKLNLDYIAQPYLKYPKEFGVFYVRYKGKSKIFSINEKLFPTIIGDGVHAIRHLALNHPRYSKHWELFLKDHDQSKVLKKGEKLRLSYIGSHTLGCKFIDRRDLITRELLIKLSSKLDSVEGFNYGRIDVKADSDLALKKGNFVAIELNGVQSLSTNIFDPSFSLWKSYKVLFQQSQWLVKIAKEHQNKEMQLLPLFSFLKKYMRMNSINEQHRELLRR